MRRLMLLCCLAWLGACATAQAQAPVARIGIIAELSGPLAEEWGPAAREIEGLLRPHAQVTIQDAHFQPASAMEAARALIERDRATILIMATEAAMAVPAAHAAIRDGVVAVSLGILPAAQLAELRGQSRFVFAVGDLPTAQARLPAAVLRARFGQGGSVAVLGAPDLVQALQLPRQAQVLSFDRDLRTTLAPARNANLLVAVSRSTAGGRNIAAEAPRNLGPQLGVVVLTAPTPLVRARVVGTLLRDLLQAHPPHPPADLANAILATRRVHDETGAIVIPWNTATPGIANVKSLVSAAFETMKPDQDTGNGTFECCDCKSSSKDCCTCQNGAKCEHTGSGSDCRSECK